MRRMRGRVCIVRFWLCANGSPRELDRRNNQVDGYNFKRCNKYFRCKKSRQANKTNIIQPINVCSLSHDGDPYLVLFPFPRIWIHWSKQQIYIHFNAETMYNCSICCPLLPTICFGNEASEYHAYNTQTNVVSFRMHDFVCCKCCTYSLFPWAQFSPDDSAFKCTQMINFHKKYTWFPTHNCLS